MNKLVATTTDAAFHVVDLRTFNENIGFAHLRHNVGVQAVVDIGKAVGC